MLLNLNSVFLPQEIITEILARLPVKSLLRFMCVSPSWLCLVSSPQFVKYHLKVSSSLPRILLSECYLKSGLMNISADSFIYEHIPYPFELELYQTVWRSCNGLVCISRNGSANAVLWNPCTRKYQQLPCVNLKMETLVATLYGLVYNESKDDYNVIGFFHAFDYLSVSVLEPEVHVYSLKNNSWKAKEDLRFGHPLFGPCKFVAGKIHVMRVKNYDYDPEPIDIVSFDTAYEDYGKIEPPNYGKGAERVSLQVLRECICVSCCKEYNVDLWVMKEYGVKESWAKTLTIPSNNFPSVELGVTISIHIH